MLRHNRRMNNILMKKNKRKKNDAEAKCVTFIA